MTWAEEKQRFEQRKLVLDELTSDARIDSLVDQLNTNIKEFTNRAGVSPSTPGQNQYQTDAEAKFVQLAEYQAHPYRLASGAGNQQRETHREYRCAGPPQPSFAGHRRRAAGDHHRRR